MSLREHLLRAEELLKESEIKDFSREAKEILAFCLSCSISDIYIDFNLKLSDEVVLRFESLVKRRAEREPLAYLFGSCDFYGLRLKVDSRVLVPRNETELMVDQIVQKLSGRDLKGAVLWDVCTGSGCIGLALKKSLPDLRVICSDLSLDALDLARENAKINDLEVEFRQGVYLEPFKGLKANFIVSNPPYVADEDYGKLEAEVLKEPKLALLGGDRGLDPYKIFEKTLHSTLLQRGMAWFEIGFDQGEAVKEIFSLSPWRKTKLYQDLAGHDRVFFLEKE